MAIKLVFNHLPQMSSQLRKEAGRIALSAAVRVERDAKQSMRGPKHGRTYRRGAISKKFSAAGGRWRKYAGMGLKAVLGGGSVRVTVGYSYHRASAPGEAPAVDTGKLVNSIESGMHGPSTAIVSASAAYAEALEEKLNRPFFKPAVERVRDWLTSAYVDMLRRLR